ncbi:MAG: DUF5054 domain-containing protein [Chloroflexi bacterium]|nr:DUF5054 domain-containing protein [Chloroflexota bacterium]
MAQADHHESVEKIHLVFKTHLDLGFTDMANAVFRHYVDDFIPAALRLARASREGGATDRFVWTTGSWLIYHFLEQASSAGRRQMEAAIAAGDIAWHALPFTTHTELMDPDLFRYGLSLSQRLDARFGRRTIAAKMTDVPGHTRGVIPLMARAGIKLLHIGVNEASTMPHVPPVFVWRDEASGHELLMIYEHHYGGIVQADGLSDALAVQMTGDNIGPPSLDALKKVYGDLRQQFPSAQILPTTLDTFAAALEAVRDQLPVLTDEIGDSWIHGVGTDPQKVRAWRELVRLRRDIVQTPESAPPRALDAFQDALLCVAEHTWGMDTKMHLAQYDSYTAEALAAARSTPPFQTMQASWDEQRAYVDRAVSALEGTHWHEAATDALLPPMMPRRSTGWRSDTRQFSTRHFEIELDPETGAIQHLQTRSDRRMWASAQQPLVLFRYETFDDADYDRFWAEYIQSKDRPAVSAWAQYDYRKPGLAGKGVRIPRTPAPIESLSVEPVGDGLSITAALAIPQEWSAAYGAPPRVTLNYNVSENRPQIDIRLAWQNKPACRIPEALWLSFMPIAPGAEWRFEKLGQWIDPARVVSGGSRGLHAVFDRVQCLHQQKRLTFVTRDAPLIAPGTPSLLRFTNELPNMNDGVHINLFNNVWGTNFPQWNEGDSVFDFQLLWE